VAPKKDKTVDGWAEVRVLLARFWPSWQVPEEQPGRIPAAGSVASLSHAGRCSHSGKWAIAVKMTAVNPIISGMAAKSQLYFNKRKLADVVEVARLGANTKPPLPITVASMLVVGTWDAAFCSILKQLVFVGRAPTVGRSPLAVAACHDFETAGLGESQALLSTGRSDEDHVADYSDVDGVISDGSGDAPGEGDVRHDGSGSAASPQPSGMLMRSTEKRPRSSSMKRRQAEIDKLLAVERVTTVTANRARRTEVRRQGRAPSSGGTSPLPRHRASPSPAALSPGARARAAGALPPRPVAFKRGRSTTPTARKRDKAASADRVAAAVESATPTPSSSLASGALSGSQGAFSYVTGIAAGGAGLGALSGGAYAPAQHLPLSPVMSSLVSAPPLVSSSPGDGTGVDADDNVPVLDDAEEFQ